MLRLITATESLYRQAKDRAARLVKQADGATAIEYGLIAAGIAVAIIAAVFALGTELGSTFNNVSSKLTR
jgi:pilus assembly protein Flp/PilA